jgi:predicted PurR-regulated permease PerM
MTAWIDRRTLSVVFTIGVTVGFLALLFAACHTLITLIFSILFAYLLEPLVGMTEKRTGGSRGRAIAATYGAVAVAFGILVATVGPRIVSEAQKLNTTLPTLLNNVSSGQIAWTVGGQHQWSYATQHVQQFLTGHREMILRYTAMIEMRAAALLSNVGWVLVVPILAIFFLLDGATLSASVVELIDASHERRFLRDVLADMGSMLAQYIRAQVLLSLMAAGAYTLFLLIIRLPYAFAVGPIAGVLEFIPLVGPLLAGVIVLAISFTTGYGHWLPIVAFWLAWRAVQDYINMPYFMGKGLQLHPLLAISAVLAGGEVGGVLGMFLSIPAVATIRVIWRNYVERVKRGRIAAGNKSDADAAA